METLEAVDQSKLCKVTNSCTTDIMIAAPITPAETPNPTSILSYNKDFEIYPASKGGFTIKTGDNDTVLLNRTHVHNSKPTYSKEYNLIATNPKWLTPVNEKVVSQDMDSDSYDAQSFAESDKTAMKQTVGFFQTISAYPSSKLAKDYVAALSSTSDDAAGKADGSADSANNVNNAVNDGVTAFFKSTKAFQQVNQVTIYLIEHYYNRFPYGWANFTDTISYFLYSSDGNKTNFNGTISMTKTGDPDITKSNGGYTCAFNPAVAPTDTTKIDVDTTKAKSLVYVNGLFVDDADADVPQIAIKGTFQLKRTFTKDPNDTNIIIVLCGTVNGVTCVGFDGAQATKPDNTTQDWLNSLFHPKTAAEIFSSVMTILGALMMIHFIGSTLYGIGNWIKEKIQEKDPVTKDDFEAQKSGTESANKAEAESAYKKVSGDKDATVPDNSEDALTNASKAQDDLSDMVSASKAETNLVRMNKNLQAAERFAAEDEALQTRIENAGDDITDAYGSVKDADIAEMRATLAELRPKLDELTKTVTKLNQDIEKVTADSEKAKMQENVDEAVSVQKDVADESQTSADETGEGEGGEPESEFLEVGELA